MKIAIPEAVTNSLRFKVGDLYAAGGNSSNTAFWLVVAITERGRIFIEPQTGEEVVLSKQEVQSSWLVRF